MSTTNVDTARMRAHAIRIHGHIKAHQGALTVAEIAEDLKINREVVGKIVRTRQWPHVRGKAARFQNRLEFPQVRELNFDA